MPTTKTRVTYETFTPKSAASGDAAKRGWIDEDGTEYTVNEAISLLKGCDASSGAFHPGIWYSRQYDENYYTGAVENHSYHLVGFSEAQEKRIYNAVAGK